MFRTVEATIDKRGKVKLAETVKLSGSRRALVTILDEESVIRNLNEAAILSESALAKGWLGPDADAAWEHLADLPEFIEDEK